MSAVTALGWAPREIAARRPERPDASPVEIAGLAKEFGVASVLHRIDLAVSPGEFVAIVGRSGCGKTTLLRLIAGLETPSAGAIGFGGAKPVTRLMFQDARLLPWRRVIENVGIGRRDAGWRDSARAALARVRLEGKAGDWPGTLSGGQLQRVALARALLSRPTLLLLDEPLGALDALTRLEMQELIAEVHAAEGFTAILVTHDVAEAVRLADRVIVLEHGAVAGSWEIRIPRPRPRANAELGMIEAAILTRLLDGR